MKHLLNKPFNQFFKHVWKEMKTEWIKPEHNQYKRKDIKQDARRYLYVWYKHKQARGNNTRYQQKFYETACRKMNKEVNWKNIKMIQDAKYKPATVLRKRRKYIKPTNEQLQKQEEKRKQYS